MAKQKKIIKTSISPLYKIGDFEPTAAMLQAVDAFLNAEEPISCRQAVEATGHHPTLLYQWLKKPGFKQWWTQAVDRKIETLHLADVKKALLHSATKRYDTPAAKLLFERYDRQYKPTTKQELDVYPGRRPEDRHQAIQASCQRLAAYQQSQRDNTDYSKPVKSKVIKGQSQTTAEPENNNESGGNTCQSKVNVQNPTPEGGADG